MPILAFLRDNAPWLTAGVLLTFLSSFGQTYFISVFAGEIRSVFGLSHGQWGGIYTLGTGASALVMVWAGGLTDRYRVRVLAPIVLLLMTGACLFMAANPVWWLLPVAIFALRFTGQGMMTHLAVVAMARWFVASRGKALSVATLGNALGESLLPLIFVSLLIVYDWRILWVTAAVIAIIGIPLLLVLLKRERTPQSWARTSQSLGMAGRQWSRQDALHHFLFWFMVPALLGPSAFNTAFFFHQVHIAEVKEIAHVELVAMFPIYTAVVIGSMVVSGFALDYLGTPRVLPFIQIPMIAGFLFFAVSDGPILLLLGFLFPGDDHGREQHRAKRVLGGVLRKCAHGQDQGDGGGHHGPWNSHRTRAYRSGHRSRAGHRIAIRHHCRIFRLLDADDDDRRRPCAPPTRVNAGDRRNRRRRHHGADAPRSPAGPCATMVGATATAEHCAAERRAASGSGRCLHHAGPCR